MCEILRRAQILYERYREQLVPHMQECTIAQDQQDKAVGTFASICRTVVAFEKGISGLTELICNCR